MLCYPPQTAHGQKYNETQEDYSHERESQCQERQEHQEFHQKLQFHQRKRL